MLSAFLPGVFLYPILKNGIYAVLPKIDDAYNYALFKKLMPSLKYKECKRKIKCTPDNKKSRRIIRREIRIHSRAEE